MPIDYSEGKIYKIVSDQTDKVYIGSTAEKTLSLRMSKHRSDYKGYCNGSRPYRTSFQLLVFDDAQIILVEKFSCNSKDELHAREEYWRQKFILVAVNKFSAYTGLTKPDYDRVYKKKPKRIEYQKRYAKTAKRKLSMKAYHQRYQLIKYHCPCGKTTSRHSKAKHFKTKNHCKWARQEQKELNVFYERGRQHSINLKQSIESFITM
jgi:hypothetical protein